jgi:hypothetical protein
MDRGAVVLAVIGSAAIGALVSSIISEIGRWRERKSRREELALTKAFEMSHTHFVSTIELIKAGRGVTMFPLTKMISEGFVMFKHLLDHGKLDPRSQKELEDELKNYAEKQSAKGGN